MSSVRRLIFDTIGRLRRDSTRPTDFGARYARLLELLWQRTSDGAPFSYQTTVLNVAAASPTLSQSHQAVAHPKRGQDDFSWLDLQSVGDLLSDFPETETAPDGYMQFSRRGSPTWNEMSWFGVNDSVLFF